MQIDKLYSCFNNPQALKNLDIKDLEALLIEAPYFQPAWMLYAKAKSSQSNVDYQKVLSQTAARVYNREQLFEFIYTLDIEKELTQNSPENQISKVEENKPHTKKVEKVPTKKTTPKETIPKIKSVANPQPPKPIIKKSGEEVKSKEDLRAIVKERLAEMDKEKDLTKDKSAEQSNPKPTPIRKKSNLDIIDSFIKQSPVINKPKDAEYKEELEVAKRSLDDKYDFVSETLAEINLKQGHKEKAIKIYQKLSLKYPEKSSYFAAQIKKINTSK